MRVAIQVVATLLLLGLAGGSVYLLNEMRPEPKSKDEQVTLPLVRSFEVKRQRAVFGVPSQGSVRPTIETKLIAEVSGRVLEVAPQLESGAYFTPDDVLLVIDPTDYEAAVADAKAQVAAAELNLAQQVADAQAQREDWQRNHPGKPAPPLVVREPQLKEARARVDSAKARQKRAERDLERCQVKALFAGRVRQESVDKGQFVTRGTQLATIYSTASAEVRLPLPSDELAFVDLPLSGPVKDGGPRVALRARFAGKTWEWPARIVRTEGEIDPRTRMVHAVARVEKPYATEGGRPPLAVGLYLHAEIEGRDAGMLARIPRALLRGEDYVLVIVDGKVRKRMVEVVRKEREHVWIDGGLNDGDEICSSALEVWSDGMQVRVETPPNEGSSGAKAGNEGSSSGVNGSGHNGTRKNAPGQGAKAGR